MMPPANGDWDENRKFVLQALQSIEEQLGRVHETLSSMRSEIAALKVKAGIWGLIGGAIPAVTTILVIWLEKRP